MLMVPTNPGAEGMCRLCCYLGRNRECSKIQRHSYVAFVKGSQPRQYQGSINEGQVPWTTNNRHELHVESSQACTEYGTCIIFVP